MQSAKYLEFDVWFQDFISRLGGFAPLHVEKWFNNVEENHKDLREFLGGSSVQKKYVIKSQQAPCKLQDAKEYIDELLKRAPGYLDSYDFDETVFLMPTAASGSHNAHKIAKHFRHYAEKRVNDKVSSMKIIDANLSKLGELWARSRTNDSSIEITISTRANGFCLLGHYGPDKDSCFRQASERTSNKYTVGQTKDSFVITIGKFIEGKQKYKNVARCFGFFRNNYTEAHLCNYYFKKGFDEGDGLFALKSLFEDLWSSKSTFHENLITFKEGNELIFQNPYANWSFTKGEGSSTASGFTEISCDSNWISYFECERCKTQSTSSLYLTKIDEIYLCKYCCKEANICQVSGVKTFLSLIKVIDIDDNQVDAHPDIANSLPKCSECGIPHTKTYHLEDKKLCVDCNDAYTTCDYCCKIMLIEDINIMFSEDICEKCVKEMLPEFSAEASELFLQLQGVSSVQI